MTTTTQQNDKLISLRMPTSVIDFAKKKAKKQGRTMSNYLRWLVMEQMDETDYLISNPANTALLLESIDQLKSGKSKIITKTIEELQAMETM
jgi:predicted DNA-binding protein